MTDSPVHMRHMPDFVAPLAAIVIDHAEGSWVYATDGTKWLDFVMGIAVMNTGHAHPRIIEAVKAQAAKVSHAQMNIYRHQPMLDLSDKLAEIVPEGMDTFVYTNSGAEAVENAIKVARTFTGRTAVVAFDHAYHGRTNLTMALTAKNMPYKRGFGPFAGEIYRVPMAYPYRWPTGPDRCADEAFDEFVSLVHAQVGEQNTAAVIIEPIQGEGGFIVPPAGYLKRIADWCTQNGILFIADEIQTGFCRTGDWFACEHEDVVPDLITTAKGIAGGLPLAAVTGRADVMDSVHSGGLGGTYGGNPVACAAAVGAIETMQAEDLCGRAREIEALFMPRLRELSEKFEVIGDIRGRGAMLAIELVSGGRDKTPNATLTSAVNAYCHSHGLVTLTAGTFGNVMRFLPPLSAGDDLLNEGLDILGQAFAANA